MKIIKLILALLITYSFLCVIVLVVLVVLRLQNTETHPDGQLVLTETETIPESGVEKKECHQYGDLEKEILCLQGQSDFLQKYIRDAETDFEKSLIPSLQDLNNTIQRQIEHAEEERVRRSRLGGGAKQNPSARISERERVLRDLHDLNNICFPLKIGREIEREYRFTGTHEELGRACFSGKKQIDTLFETHYHRSIVKYDAPSEFSKVDAGALDDLRTRGLCLDKLREDTLQKDTNRGW